MKTIACVVGTTLALAAVCAPSATAQLPPLPPIIPPGGTPTPPGQPDPQPQPPEPAPPAPVSPAAGTVTSGGGIDVANTRHFADDSLVPPFQQRWSVPETAVASVLTADGRVYVAGGSVVRARDQANGQVLWTAEGPAHGGGAGASAAYDGGVLVVQAGRVMRAYDAATGAVKWTKDYSQQSGSFFDVRPVVATGGVVYGGDDNDLYAFRASDGSEVWTRKASSGRPSIDDARLYLPGCGTAVQAIDRRTGEDAWSARGGCSGTTSAPPTVFGGRLYTSGRVSETGQGVVLDPATGASLGSHPGGNQIFVDGLAIRHRFGAINDESMHAFDLATGAERWKRAKPILRNYVAVGHDVYGLAEDGRRVNLVAMDAETGTLFGSLKLPGLRENDWYGRIAPAPGVLIVAVNGHLTAFESALRPDPQGVALGFDTEVRSGARAGLVAVVGSGMSAARPEVQVERAGWRGGKFKKTGTAKPFRDGGADVRVTVNRNSRVRVRVGDAVSAPVTVYAWPRLGFGKPRWIDNRRVRVSHVVRTPGTDLRGARLVMYLDRRKTKTLTRLATAPLRAAGRGRTRATMQFAPPRNISEKDYLLLCVERGLSRGLGVPNNFTKKCGARTIRE